MHGCVHSSLLRQHINMPMTHAPLHVLNKAAASQDISQATLITWTEIGESKAQDGP